MVFALLTGAVINRHARFAGIYRSTITSPVAEPAVTGATLAVLLTSDFKV